MIDIDTIRHDFPILRSRVYGKPLIYLDNAATSQKPTVVLDRVRSFYQETNGNIHRGIHYMSERASADYEAARERVRRFINANNVREIVFTKGATDSINIAAMCFAQSFLGKSDEVLITEMEHHSNIVPWQMACKRSGAVLRVIPFDDKGNLRIDLLESLVSERTRLIAVCAVSNVLGTVNPLKEIIAFSRPRGIRILVDASQAVQHAPVDVRALDCDFLVFSGHKMYAEMGIGVLYGKEELLERMDPCCFGGGMIGSVSLNRTTFAEPPYKFEPGTPNVAGALGLETAIDYIETVGLDTIAAHESRLLDRAARGIATCDGASIYGNPARAGCISFNLMGTNPSDVSSLLDKMGIAVRSGHHCAEPAIRHFGVPGMVRASFAMYNTEEEVDALVQGVHRARDLILA